MDHVGWAAAATLGFATIMWVASVIRTDASLVDRVWGVFFVIIAWTAHLVAPGGSRSLLVAVLVTVWGLHLSASLTWRNWGEYVATVNVFVPGPRKAPPS